MLRRWTPRARGIALVLLAEVLFAAATVIVKRLSQGGVDALTVAFGRFALGAVFFGGAFAWRGRTWRATAPFAVLGRALTNAAAVVLFYESIALTTVTNANVLNMTYPLFIAALGPLVLRERTRLAHVVALACGLPGIWLVVAPQFGQHFNAGDIVGLMCGIVSAVAVMFLRVARQQDDADRILLWVMALGTVATAPYAAGVRVMTAAQWGWWLTAAAMGVFGQFLLTSGYRWVTAVEGSVTSSARIFFGAMFGVAVFSDPLTPRIVFGALLILAGVVMVSRGQARTATD